MPLHCGACGHPKSHLYTSVELGTASGLVLHQPKPGPQFTALCGPGLGGKWSIYTCTHNQTLDTYTSPSPSPH